MSDGNRSGVQRVLISDFTMGQVSIRYAGRLDTELRTHACEEITGFYIHPDGGLRRRPGSVYVDVALNHTPSTSGLYAADAIPSFVVFEGSSTTWLGHIWSSTDFRITRLTTSSSVDVSATSLPVGEELWTNGMIEDPASSLQYLHCWSPTDSFRMCHESATLSRPSEYDLAIIFQNRLIGADRSAGTFIMTPPLEYTELTSDTLSATADFAGVETVRWMKARQSIYVGTDRGEYELYSNFGYFNEELGGLMLRRISDIGTEHAIYYGRGMALFYDRSLMVMEYSGSGFDYNVRSLSDQIDNGEWITCAAVEYGTHRYLLGLDRDQDLWCYVQSPATQVGGWTKIRSDCGWVAVFEKDAYVAYERGTSYRVDVIPLNTLAFPGDRTATESQLYYLNDVHGESGGYLTVHTSVTGDVLPGSTTMAVWTIGTAGSTYKGALATGAAGTFNTTDLQTLIGYTSSELYVYAYESGQTTPGSIKTLPMTVLLGEKHRCVRVVLQVWESRGAKVRVNSGAWVQITTSVAYSGPWEYPVAHSFSEEPQIEVQPVSDMPLNLYQILADVVVGEP